MTIHLDQRNTVEVSDTDTTVVSVSTPGPQGPAGAIDTSDVDYIQFALSYADGTAEGKLSWNADDGTLELGMPGGSVNLQIGQEHLVRVKNDSGADITNGSVVYLSGVTGHRPEVALADASDVNKSQAIAIATETITNGQTGYCSIGSGLVRGMDTSSFAATNPVYLSAAVPGALTTTKPSAPNRSYLVGFVIYSHATEGSIYFFPRRDPKLDELTDFSGTPSDGQVPVYDNATSTWIPTDQSSGGGDAINSAPGDVADLVAGQTFHFPDIALKNQATLTGEGWGVTGDAVNPATFAITADAYSGENALEIVIPGASTGGNYAPGANFPMAVAANDPFDLVVILTQKAHILGVNGNSHGRGYGFSIGVGDTGTDRFFSVCAATLSATGPRLYFSSNPGVFSTGAFGSLGSTVFGPIKFHVLRIMRISTTIFYGAMPVGSVGGYVTARNEGFTSLTNDGWLEAGSEAHSGAITHLSVGAMHQFPYEQTVRVQSILRLI